MIIKISLRILAISIFLTRISAQTPRGEALIDSMIASLKIPSSFSLIEQVNHYPDGKSRLFQFELFSGDGGSNSLIRYIKPSSVRGQTFLLRNSGDEIWTFSPRTRRVRKLASHYKKQKVQGSDFTFEDFSSEDMWREDYSTKTTGETNLNNNPCWLLESVAYPRVNTDFPKIVTMLRKEDFYPLRIMYHNNKGFLEKTMILDDIRLIDGYLNAMTITMENHLTRSNTVMNTLDFDPRWTPENNFFSERSLKK